MKIIFNNEGKYRGFLKSPFPSSIREVYSKNFKVSWNGKGKYRGCRKTPDNENWIKNSVCLIMTEKGWGTGTIISESGLLLTCAHVIFDNNEWEKCKNIRIIKNGTSLDAKIELINLDKDIAFLRLQATTPLKYFIPLSTEQPCQGDEISVIGFPHSGEEILNLAKTNGEIQDIDQYIIKTSATIGGGSSGSPILLNDRLIGMVTSSSKDYSSDIFGKSHGIAKFAIEENLLQNVEGKLTYVIDEEPNG